MRAVQAGQVTIGGTAPLVLIAGPCVIESREHTLRMAEALVRITDEVGIPLIFKSSFDKANRSSLDAFRGPGLDAGLAILAEAKACLGVPLLSDIHLPGQATAAAEVLDVIQIPAFLCRQTDLIAAAARTGRPVNLKKGQFLAPWDMKPAVAKLERLGAAGVLLTERGTCFGYNNLILDPRSLVIMRNLGWPVVFDATHCVQLPGGLGDRTGGQREYVPVLARAAAAVGIDALFIEVHDQPEQARSDSSSMLALADLPALLRTVRAIDAVYREQQAR